MSQTKQYSSITDPPRTVKEAIDWLICIGGDDVKKVGKAQNTSAIQNAVKALTGSRMSLQSEIKQLIEGLGGFIGYQGGTISGSSIIKNGQSSYQSAYNSSNATWPTCGQKGTCSCCTQNGCNCQSTGTAPCNGSCCNRCDIRICAGIFVALVPALHTALDGLKKKCNENKQQAINSDGLKGYFTALGYQESYLNDRLTGSTVSSKLWSATSGLKQMKEKIESAFKNNTGRPNQNGFTATDKSIDTSKATPTTPKTVREMLLWLMGLPYCEGYKKFVDELKTKSQQEPFKSIVTSTGKPSSTNANPLAKELSAVIFHLPTVFFTVEGNISYLKEIFEQFKKDSDPKPKFHYPTDGEECLNTLSAYVAVCYPILKYLMQRCDKEDSRRGARGPRGAQTSTTPTADEKDGSWGDLMVSGEKNSSTEGQTKSSTATPSSAPQTALRDYLVFMGFNATNNKVTGNDLHDNALKDCFSPNVKTEDEDDDDKGGATGTRLSRSGGRTSSKKYEKLPALRKLAKKVLQYMYSPGGSPGGGGAGGGEKVTPTTIRQMMLWLIGLPLTTAYKSSTGNSLVGKDGPVLQGINNNPALMKLEQSGRRLRHSTSTTATGKHFKQQLKDSIVGMIMLFQRIEGGLGSVLEFLKEGFIDKSGTGSQGAQSFKYDQDKLFNDFKGYVYKVHVQLRFLKVMCKEDGDKGGWSKCRLKAYGTNGGNVTALTCSCSGSGLNTGCQNALNGFLVGGTSSSSKNIFQNDSGGEEKHMGFKGIDLSSNIRGSDIHTHLQLMLDPIPTTTAASQSPTTSKPLSLLTQYCVAIGPLEPQSLGDHFDVFRELAVGGMWSKIKTDIEKDSLRGITKDDGQGETASEKLKTALTAVWPSSHNGTHPSDLVSLTGCQQQSPNNCSPFVASLSHGLYKYFDPTKLSSPAQKINWLYMKMSGLYGKLAALKEAMESKCQCCKSGDSKSCAGIIKCPNCLPLMYKMGLVFGSAQALTSKDKQCRDLHNVMENVLVTTTSKLCIVFKSIDDKRFWPYLLFSAMVVKEKLTDGQLTVKNGDENYNCYTYALGDEVYTQYLKEKKNEDKQAAEKNKSTREGHLACNCSPHQYNAPAAGTGTATTVTLTLYFHKDGVTTKLELKAAHHGPTYNPLVRLYPRNLKSIVDWLLRIGQTRLDQDTSAASANDTGLKEMCEKFMPVVKECLKKEDKEAFQQLVKGVMSLMGLENKGKDDVDKEVQEKLNDVKDTKLKEKINSFQQTFSSILKFKPKDYIDKVIEDFGQKLSTLDGKNNNGNRSFNCVAKAVSTCMKTALGQIKQLANTNKELEKTYHVTGIEDLKDKTITEVSSLDSIEQLKTLCDGFRSFHTAYTTFTGAFNSHLNTAQNNGTWSKINKCVEAFNELGKCVEDLQALNGMSSADKMTEASGKLNDISGKLKDVHEKLNGDDLSTFSEKVNEFIKELDKKLIEAGKGRIETALQLNGKSQNFDDIIRAYITNVISGMKSNHKECDIHLRVRNDLQQLSECLKVMCEVCSTGMTEFAHTLKECVAMAKGHLDKINETKSKLTDLSSKLTNIKDGSKHSEMTQLKSSITTIHSLLSNQYIYNPPIIVKEQITQQYVTKMTKYLKQLPDLIRDRYVLQKWKDDSAHFCGVQRFQGGIVKTSDITGITGVLKELLKDIYHNATEVTIHEFQVRALIYNFCQKEGIKRIDCGIKVMRDVTEKINDKVEWDKIKDNKELKRVVNDNSGNSYLRYFASHLRDSTEYYSFRNCGIKHRLSPNLANAVMTDNYIRDTK